MGSVEVRDRRERLFNEHYRYGFILGRTVARETRAYARGLSTNAFLDCVKQRMWRGDLASFLRLEVSKLAAERNKTLRLAGALVTKKYQQERKANLQRLKEAQVFDLETAFYTGAIDSYLNPEKEMLVIDPSRGLPQVLLLE